MSSHSTCKRLYIHHYVMQLCPCRCVLMEMPGFSVDPSSFDIIESIYRVYAVVLLTHRVLALTPYFYDTGSHISFYWRQLWGKPENDVALKARYEKAVKMLYGDEQGYIEKKNTKLFQQLERLHKQWQDAMEEQAAFWKKCIEEKKEEIRSVKTKKEDIKHKSRDSEGRKDKEESDTLSAYVLALHMLLRENP